MLSPSSLLVFLRRFAIACVAVTVVTAVGVAGGKAYGKKKFEESRTIEIPGGILVPTQQGQPANYLLIGSDVRPPDETPAEAKAYGTQKDTGGGRSDVMMVLHVEPANHTGFLVSFPRDLVVDIPGHHRALLNEAYADGGPALVIETLRQNFAPLEINHYLEVDFRGFKSIVNAIGHIHIWFPTPVHDPFTGLDVGQRSCATFNGDQALAYARSRHYFVPKDLQHPAPWTWDYARQRGGQGWIATGSDIDRIPRQQYFLRTISQAAIDKTGNAPQAIGGLLDAIFKNFAHDQNLKYEELTTLALTFRDLKPDKIQMETLPNAPATGAFAQHVIAKQPEALYVIERLARFPTPAPAIPRPLPADRVKVRVVNGSGVKGAAQRALDAFTAAGFRSAGPAEDANQSDFSKTQLRYAPGKSFEGLTVAFALGTPNLVPAASAQNTLGGDVLVIVGKDYDELPLNFAGLPKESTSTSAVARKTTSTVKRATITTTTTTTTRPRVTVDTRFVPVDPKTGGSLVGCPNK